MLTFASVKQIAKTKPFPFFIAVGLFFVITYAFFGKILTSSLQEPLSPTLPKVEVVQSHSQKIRPLLKLSAETKASKVTTLRAEVAGRIVNILEEKGQVLEAGQPILKIIDNDQAARLSYAQSSLTHRTAEFEAAKKLKSKNFMAENTFLEAKANLESAKANLAKIQHECDHLTLKAPFKGYYENRFVEEGDYVNIGDQLVCFVDLSTLKLCAYVSEKEILKIQLRQSATLFISSYEKPLTATVSYISKVADPKTRSFLVEFILNNNTLHLPGGLTAKVEVSKEEQDVHSLPPSLLTLNDEGIVGVMAIENQNQAIFKPVEILQSEQESVYLTGLAPSVTLISVGSNFIKSGQEVEPITAQEESSGP